MQWVANKHWEIHPQTYVINEKNNVLESHDVDLKNDMLDVL
jgi:hypothetical protein